LRAAGFRERGEAGFHFGEGEGCGTGRVAVQQVGSGCSQVARAAIGGAKGLGAGGRELGDGSGEQRASDVEHPAIGFRERSSGKPERGAAGVLDGEAEEIVGEQGPLFELLRSGGKRVVKFGEGEEGGHG